MPLNDIPKSNNTVNVQFVDTTFRIINGPLNNFVGPTIKGRESLDVGAFAYFIIHTDPQSGQERKILFDLGAPKNWKEELPPSLAERIRAWEDNGATIIAEKYISEVLEDNGVDLADIEALVWSHAHFDHTGRPSLFPTSVKLIVGPALKTMFSPGYPENPNAPFRAKEFANRSVIELSFDSSTLTIGGMKAIDFFGDGSFYFLDAPGHAVGHINALARTTTSASDNGGKDTFIFLGADSYHVGSQLRPNEYTPLPQSIELMNFNPCPCPGELFEKINPLPLGGHASKTPFHIIPEKSVALNAAQAQEVISKLQVFDADENIFVVNAHEWNYYDILEVFPKSANHWKEKGWKDKSRWRFLQEFQKAVDIATVRL
ncbi:hypothetical protein ABW20_dc0101267 [Dactylellina cionopaga]|nr:hypothetical protein ABW20_dc0101267 [Dactylellina cionopaga]